MEVEEGESRGFLGREPRKGVLRPLVRLRGGVGDREWLRLRMCRSKCWGRRGVCSCEPGLVVGLRALFPQYLWEAQGSSSNSPGRRERRLCVLSFLPGTQPSLAECLLHGCSRPPHAAGEGFWSWPLVPLRGGVTVLRW